MLIRATKENLLLKEGVGGEIPLPWGPKALAFYQFQALCTFI